MLRKSFLTFKVFEAKYFLNTFSTMAKEYIENPSTLQEGSRFERKFVDVSDKFNNLNLNKVFSIASYNVLSQNLLNRHPENYIKIDKRLLSWYYRSQQIIEEIIHHMPDIVCLQEVHHAHYKSFFMERLNKYGYFGKYKARPGQENEDGCATFFKTNKFTLLEYQSLEYDSFDEEIDGKSNVALLMVLFFKYTHKIVCVANTHILFNPKRGDIKLTQLSILLAKVTSLKMKYSKKNEKKKIQKNSFPKKKFSKPENCGVIICGDFNFTPFSPLYDFLSLGNLNLSNLYCSDMSGFSTSFSFSGVPLITKKFLPNQINSNCEFIQKVAGRSETVDNLPCNSIKPTVINQVSGTSIPLQNSMIPNKPVVSNNFEIQKNIKSSNNIDIKPPHFLSHNLKLTSAYPHVVHVHTMQQNFIDTQVTQKVINEDGKTLDYIFYGVSQKKVINENNISVSKACQESNLKLLSYLQLPLTCSFLQPLPNYINGSDHLLIMAKFHFS